MIGAGMSQVEAAAKGERFARAAQRLIGAGHEASSPVVAAFVPGRIEVFGKHTDYCGGRSLVCTVERGICIVAVPSAQPRIRFFALDLGEDGQWPLSPDLEPTTGHWTNYPMTVTRRIARNFPTASAGADIAVSSDLPAAAGLSSSSAMIIGTFLLLSAVNHLADNAAYRTNICSTEDLAAYVACIENGQSFRELQGDRGVGTFGGSQDHTAILCCRPGQLSLYSFCPIQFQSHLDFPDDLIFFVAGSNVVAEKTGDARAKYNRVSQRAAKIVELWNQNNTPLARCLRDVVRAEAARLASFSRILAEYDSQNTAQRLVARMEQFKSESEVLIPAATAAIASRDWTALKEITAQSQRGAEKNLENQVPETIGLCRELLEHGAIASSAFGAGFGGSVWALFHNNNSQPPGSSPIKSGGFFTRPGCPAVAITV